MLKRFILKKLVILGLLEVATLVFLLPTHLANAAGDGWFSIGSFSSGAVSSFLGFFLNEIFKIIFGLIGILATTLNYAINVRAGGGVPVVSATWHILRDFSNMLFVIILVYVAFATIFDQKNYSFQPMITRFIIVAVMINFSLAIGNIVIDACQVLTNIFLGSIGNVGDRIGQFLNPSLLLPSNVNPADIAASGLTSAVFAVVLGAIMLFSLLVATTFSLIRVPFIWGLLIVSPLAWMSYIMPNSNGWWGKWWGQFIGWNLFLPVYLFFMYIGLLFLSKRDEIMSTVIQVNSGAANPANTPLLFGLTNTLTFNLIFFYIFTAVIMIGGTGVAVSVTKMMGGTGFEKGLGWARSFAGKVSGYDLRRDALKSAKDARLGEFQQQGFKNPYLNKIYGGKNADDRIRAGYMDKFGPSGSSEVGKQFLKDTEKSYKSAESDYNSGKLNIEQIRAKVSSTNASSADGYAYRKLAASKGVLTDAEFMRTLTSLEKNPAAMKDLVSTAKGNKFAGIKDLRSIALNPRIGGVEFTPTKRDMLIHISSDEKLAANLTIADIKTAFSIMGGKDSPEANTFLKNIEKVRPDLVYNFKKENGLLKSPNDTLFGAIRGAINTDPKNIANLHKDIWSSREFADALREKLSDQRVSQKNRNSFRNRLENILLENGDDKKLDILENIAPKKRFEDQGDIGDGQTGQQGTGEPQGGTISYREDTGLNHANIIDLRNKKDIEIK